tara:strand:- start:792 stop:1148 length:357 start_codon:yes stop_codon:yes gene_type:complete
MVIIVALELPTSIPGNPDHEPSDHSVLRPLSKAINLLFSPSVRGNAAEPPSSVSISKKSPGTISLGQSLLGGTSQELDAELAVIDIIAIEKIEKRRMSDAPEWANLPTKPSPTISASF